MYGRRRRRIGGKQEGMGRCQGGRYGRSQVRLSIYQWRIQDFWIGGAPVCMDRGRQFGRGGGGGQVRWHSRLWAEIKKKKKKA